MKEQFAKLIDVKTIVTFVITAVLAYLSCIGKVSAEQFMVIAVMVLTYFFTKTSVPPNTTTTTETTTVARTVDPPTTVRTVVSPVVENEVP